ncbi:MAG: radical SAM protein [Thermoplasmata archaeon]|nr:radical SAM protein [Thermoplasmata archaeon]
MYVIQPPKLKKGLPQKTKSICPVCGKVIPATIYEEDGKIWYKKTCPEHGEFRDIYYGDAEVWHWMEKWGTILDGVGPEYPKIENGFFDKHYSFTALANLDLTNRCNLRCPICFANANAAGYVYEPDFDTVVEMMKLLREERPVPTPAIQFAGGEPTIYPRFFDVIRKAKELGFPQIQVATNGILIANDPTFAQRMVDAGMHTVYLQFDGFKESTYITARGVNLLPQKMKAIENLRNVKPKPLATVLVPTVVKGMNDDEVGKIVEFGLQNLDVIRAVNFQPVSLSGRIPQGELFKMRYTTGDLIRDLHEQTDFIEKTDFFPIPVAALFAEVAAQIFKKPEPSFTTHPACGAATYIFHDYEKDKNIPITRFIDVPGLMEELIPMVFNEEFEKKSKLGSVLTLYRLLKRHFDKKYAPTGFKLKEILTVFEQGTKDALGKLHWDSMFIGAMHFQDAYNYDLKRIQRCVIHYVTPDLKLIPFCSYNTGPVFREKVEKKHSISLEEYRKRHGKVVGVEG